MKYLLILILCLLATAKVLLQSRFAKNKTKYFSDSALFNGVMFGTMALISLPSVFRGVDLPLVVGAAAFGTFNLSFQLLYLIALSCGPTSVTSLIVSLASMIPTVVSATVYKEPLTAAGIAGIILIVIMLYLNADIKRDTFKKEPSSNNAKWFFLTMVAFSLNSLGILSQKVYTEVTSATRSAAFIGVSSLVASVLSLTVYLIMHLRGHKASYKISVKNLFPGVIIGIILGTLQSLNPYSVSTINGTLLFPAYSGGATIAIALGSRIIFREKLSPKQLASLIIGTVAIVLISI